MNDSVNWTAALSVPSRHWRLLTPLPAALIDPGHRHRFLQQCQMFSAQVDRHQRETRRIPARVRQTLNKPGANRVLDIGTASVGQNLDYFFL